MPQDSNQTRSVPEDTGTFLPSIESLFLPGCTHLFRPSDLTFSFCEVLLESHLLCGTFPKWWRPQAISPSSAPAALAGLKAPFQLARAPADGCLHLIWPTSSLLLGGILCFAVFPELGTGCNNVCSVMFALKDERSAA